MSGLKDKLLAKVGGKNGNKKSVENLVFFVIILIVTIIFINYIWKGDNKEKKQNTKSDLLADNSLEMQACNGEDVSDSSDNIEKKLENLLKNLNGVEDVKVLITYSETNKIVPMYNEDNQQSVTKEEDTRRSGLEQLMKILVKKRLFMKNIMDRKML